ncbi:hypothetical protein F5X97DRAFT_78037 [Nemania serpens]|nr:hypothetical protein F5X97DRAFT_78037 [Nemania serpens]
MTLILSLIIITWIQDLSLLLPIVRSTTDIHAHERISSPGDAGIEAPKSNEHRPNRAAIHQRQNKTARLDQKTCDTTSLPHCICPVTVCSRSLPQRPGAHSK